MRGDGASMLNESTWLPGAPIKNNILECCSRFLIFVILRRRLILLFATGTFFGGHATHVVSSVSCDFYCMSDV